MTATRVAITSDSAHCFPASFAKGLHLGRTHVPNPECMGCSFSFERGSVPDPALVRSLVENRSTQHSKLLLHTVPFCTCFSTVCIRTVALASLECSPPGVYICSPVRLVPGMAGKSGGSSARQAWIRIIYLMTHSGRTDPELEQLQLIGRCGCGVHGALASVHVVATARAGINRAAASGFH